MRPFSKAIRTIAVATVLAALCGCSEYLDRRDTISRSGGNAVAANVATHTVDPWPRASANRDIAFNGARIESAFARYRNNRVTAPRGIGTSSTYQDAAPAAGSNSGPVGQPVTAPAAPVK
ncbi:MAG TPA: hypothetical protein VFB29_15650 [Pseudolabrys sp.]|nr:hypothetical protein [Pseudolabrys sp.]